MSQFQCGGPSEFGPCLSSNVGDLPLRTPTYHRLGGPLPRQLPNRTHGHPLPPKIYYKGDAASAMHGGLIHVSMGYTPVKDRFHTRYSPVRRSPSAYCYAMLPLDLHVLSLSLAFILSQDQTLHGMNFICFFFLSRRPAARLRGHPRRASVAACFSNLPIS